MSPLILVRGVRQLLTLRGPGGPRRGAALRDLGIIGDGALLIRDGIIQDVGPSRRIENLSVARQATHIDAGGRVVMPGFVDSHTHLPFSLPWFNEFERQIGASAVQHADGCADQESEGFRATCRSLRTVPARRLELQAAEFLGRLSRHGTTTLECKSGWGPDEGTELKFLRLVAGLDRKPLDVAASFLAGRVISSQYKGDGHAYVTAMCADFLPKVRRLKLARFADLDCSSSLGPEAMRRYYESARLLGFELKAHAGVTALPDAIRLAVEFEVVSVDHLDEAPDEDLQAVARSTSIATLLPGRTHHSATGRYAPARMLIEGGAAVALATGFHPGHCPIYSMQAIVGLACARLRMSPAEAISAATINAAHALRLAHRIGSLEPGKQADLLICNASDYREIPYYLGANSVYLTMKRGAILYREGTDWPCPPH